MRVIFETKHVRDLFFSEVIKHNFSTWNELANFLNLDRKLLLEYRSGRLSFPKKYFDKLQNFLNKKYLNFFKRKIILKEDNWGRIKGGKSNYKLHKGIYDEGRKKAINFLRNLPPKFDIYQLLSEDLAYFIGLFIGDGFCGHYQRYYLIQFIGHLCERKYYEELISNIWFKLFNLMPKIKQGKGNYIRVNYYSKDLFNLITKRFKIQPGNKTKTVLIPQEILFSKDKYIQSCIAGLYDAEASFYFDDRIRYKKPYPILEFHIHNLSLVLQISDLLTRFEIKHYVRDKKRIYLYGEQSLKQFLKKIPVKNPKLIERIPKNYF